MLFNVNIDDNYANVFTYWCPNEEFFSMYVVFSEEDLLGGIYLIFFVFATVQVIISLFFSAATVYFFKVCMLNSW